MFIRHVEIDFDAVQYKAWTKGVNTQLVAASYQLSHRYGAHPHTAFGCKRVHRQCKELELSGAGCEIFELIG